MIKISSPFYCIAFAGLLLAGCAGTQNTTTANVPSLKETFKDDFLIGAALNAEQIVEKDAGAKALVPRHFNAVTPENIMKAEVIHPEWSRYNFDTADKMVAYAQKHNLQVNGHTLIWHSQLPPFVRRMKNADSVRQFFTEHINTVASRYDGKVHTWDVVNEALEEDGTMRKSIFLEKLGEDYVVEAFRLAQKATPNAKLYYNDYNIEEPKKRAGAIRLIKKIQEAGVRIDGVGIQGHWRAYNVPLADIEQSIKEYAALGLEIAFTELDLGVLQHPREVAGADVNQSAAYQAAMNPYTTSLPDSMQQKLSNNYAALFRLFLKYKDNISRVTFWGVHDGQSWLNDWPIRGRTNHPLLFDRQSQPKPAFYKVIETKTAPAKAGF
ncbi:endo-1,4-beta-xylanase [Flavisolibacter sp. BT320]|nr:endo-1,4-beta-xylanase [Flavisolibacter longurius]